MLGSFAYGSDLWADRMLFGATVRSPHPSARIRSIDVSGALAVHGARTVSTAEDLPAKRTYGLAFADQPVLAWDVVRYVGEPVAIVVADDPELSRLAADAVRVEYEPLPAVTDMEEALRPDAPKVAEIGNVLRPPRRGRWRGTESRRSAAAQRPG